MTVPNPTDRVLNVVSSLLESLDKTTKAVGGHFTKIQKYNEDVTKSFSKAVLGAELMSSAIQKGLGSIISIAGKVSDLFNQAASTQTSIISTAGNVMKLAGYNFSQATSFVEDFQSQMSEVAAKLPGMASDFASFGRGIIDDVIPAFAGLDGKLDSIEKKAALSRLKDLSTFGTLLAQTAGIDPTRASSQAAYFLSGTRTLTQLKTLDLYEKNTTFKNQLESLLGGRDLRKLSGGERQRIFLQAARLDPKVLDALSESVEGVFGTINDKLFGLQTGIFGLMRDVDPNTDGQQSAFKSINKGLLDLFGTNGLFEVLGDTLKILGVTGGDPMKVLRDAANSFAARVRYLRDVLLEFNALRDLGKLQNDLNYFFSKSLSFELIGKKLAEFVNTAFSFIAGSNSPIFYSTLATVIGQGLIGIVRGIGSFLANLDGSVYAAIGAGILLKMGVTALFKVIAARLVTIGATWFASTILPTLLAQIAPVIMGLFSGPAGWITLAVAAVGAIIIGLIKSPKLRSDIIGGFNKLRDAVVNFFDELITAIPIVGDIYKRATDNVDSKFGKGTSKNALRFGGLGFSGIGVLDKLLNWSDFQKWFSNPTGKTPNSAAGLNYQGLLSAASREMSQAPAGSGLVVANTSEAILNRQQQAQLMSGLNSGGLTIGSITINTQAKDAEQIAKTLVNHIQQEYRKYSQNNLAIAVN